MRPDAGTRPPRLAVFDLDHTLLAGDSDYLWGEFLVAEGLVDGAEYARENRRYYEAYLAGDLDIDAFAAFSLAPLVRHGRAVLDPLRTRFVRERIAPIVAPGAPALLERHRAEGDTLVITTATNRYITEPIAALLGVEHLIATDPEQQNGRHTGRIAGTANFQRGKCLRLQSWQATHNLEHAQICCYSDSHNDLPLLELADTAIAVDPDPKLRAIAERRGWRIISLRTESVHSD